MGSRVNRLMSRKHFWIYVAIGVVALSALVVTVVIPLSFRLQEIINPQAPTLSLPDLNACTRIEIEYRPSMFEFFFPRDHEKGLLDPDEMRDLQSLGTIVLEDSESIATVAHEMALASDPVPLTRPGTTPNLVEVRCYQDGKHLTSFVTRNGRIVETENGAQLECRVYRALQQLTPQVRPFRQRVMCAHRLHTLAATFYVLPGEGKTYPQPSEWCDVLAQGLRDRHQSEESIGERFACPNMQEGPCHYAINPNCAPNSPPETVLLFETRAGWNQHGGPELFTFDNHDPRGGCVLLNDGTVKFIRTEEELRALRWK